MNPKKGRDVLYCCIKKNMDRDRAKRQEILAIIARIILMSVLQLYMAHRIGSYLLCTCGALTNSKAPRHLEATARSIP